MGGWVVPAGAIHTFICGSRPVSVSKWMVICPSTQRDLAQTECSAGEITLRVAQVIRVGGSCVIIKWNDITQTRIYL